jgi:hypothetical protein
MDMAYDRFSEYDESNDPYYATRQFLAPQYSTLPVEDIETILESAFPDMSPEEAENFFRNIGRTFSNVGREIGRRAPGILSGAVQGATTGAALGPWGILGGALAGGALGGATYKPQPGQRPSAAGIAGQVGQAALGGLLGGRGGAAGMVGQMGQAALGSLLGGRGPASQQLLAMLAQPQTLQAVMSPLFGAAGRQAVQAGGRTLPVSSILSTLGTLATRAAEEYETAEAEGEAAYLTDAEGQYVVDPANPDARAAYILNALHTANEAFFAGEYDEDYEYDEAEESDESYDEVMEFDETFYEILEDYEYDEFDE